MIKKYVFGLFIVVGGLLSALHPLSASAQVAPAIIISEINWAGSSLSTADEWLYLYNAGSSDVDASGFVLTGSATSGGALSIADGTTIVAGSSLLISNYPLGEKSVLTVPPDLVTTALSLPNSGLHVILAMADGTVLDEVNFGSTHHYGSTNPFASAVRDRTTLEWRTEAPEVIPEPEIVAEVITDDSGSEPPPAPPLEGGEPITSPEIAVEVDPSVDPVATEVVTVPEEPTEAPSVSPMTGGEITETAVVEEVIVAPEPATVESTEPLQVEAEAVIETTPPDLEGPGEAIEPAVGAESVTSPVESNTPTDEPAHFSVGAITISEILSDPAEGNEWIELYNPGTDEIDLTDWFVTDESDKQTMLTGTVEAQSFFVVDAPKGKLNNDGDAVKLFGPNGELIDAMTYGTADLKAPKKGQSLSFIDGTWSAAEPTKGTTNNQPTVTEELYDAPSPTLTITTDEPTTIQDDQSEPTEDVTDVSAGGSSAHRIIAVAAPVSTPTKKISATKATTAAKTSTAKKSTSSAVSTTKISGVVTALPGTFGDQVMFIDGIQIYANNKDWPVLSVGDVVTVTGTLSTNRGEQRIKIKTAADVKVTGTQESTATEVSSGQLANLPEGRLVTVNGYITERDGDKLTIEDETGAITVIAYAKTGISWQDLPSSQVRITGVVRHIDGQALVYPRDSADVEFITDEAPSISPDVAGGVITSDVTGGNIDWLSYLAYALLGGTLAALAFWFLRSLKNPNLTNQ